MIHMLVIMCLFSQIKTILPEKPWEIEIVTRKTQEYLLLTRQDPITLTVDGPTDLRVYTRILIPDNGHKNQVYKLILTEGLLDEQIISYETDISLITTDQHGTPVSKWRSFYIHVPEGKNTYTLTHWTSPKDTILLRFAYESPEPWNDLRAITYHSLLSTVEDDKTVRYHLLKKDAPITVKLQGPTKLKVIARLNFDETLFGEQSFSIVIDDNGTVNSLPFQCHKSDDTQYTDRNDIVPSNIRTSTIPISTGSHTLVFTLSGTLAKSASLRFLVKP